MNNHSLIEQLYNLIRTLQKENFELKQLLKTNNIEINASYEVDENLIENNELFDLDQGSRIVNKAISDKDTRNFFALFHGRADVYAKRGKNGGYFPQCANRWNNSCPIYNGNTNKCLKDCVNKKYSPITMRVLKNHLYGYKEDGSDVIGIYPLFGDDTCRFIVFDFDNHDKDDLDNKHWIEEVNILRQICKDNDICCLVERSRSGNGAHVWILFSEPIKASIARYFGLLLINKGLSNENIRNFNYFDRIYPSQDSKNNLGSLVALPLQGNALKQGNSAFVDENWNAYPDQWKYLYTNVKRYNRNQIQIYIQKWTNELSIQDNDYLSNEERVKPWRRKTNFDLDDVIGNMNIVLSDGIYIDSLNLLAKIKNQIRSLAAFDNPIYYRNKNLGLSNYNNTSVVYLGEDINGYIHLPRGVYDELIDRSNSANIEYRIINERINGKEINVGFNGSLKPEQETAVKEILNYNDGILSAATAFGKTVVCSYIIAQRKVSTLILLQSSSLLKQWIDELNKFLLIDEQLPTYKTKTGIVKQRKELIGQLQANKSTLTGIVDIAMIGSLTNRNDIDDILSNYGMVILDECHHGASNSAINILKRVKSKYLYGVSATPYRSDKLEKINYMLLGPIRYSYSSKEKLKSQAIKHYVLPRYTRMVDSYSSKNNINAAYNLISNNELRNKTIIEDVFKSLNEERTPLVLTKQKDQAKCIYDNLKQVLNNVFIVYGDNSEKENNEIIAKLKKMDDKDKYVLVATGQKIGEGFDLPRLDTLMLASPVSYEGRVEQYLGRLNRTYPSKKDVIVYDYIDSHMKYFNNMYFKRLKTYKRIGYEVIDSISNRQKAKFIYDSYSYLEVFEKDLMNANRSIIISSPKLSNDKVERFINLIKTKQEQGVEIRVICSSYDIDNNINQALAYKLNNIGIETIMKEDMKTCFAVIDDELVWHGGMNLLGKADYYDNLMRFESKETAAELLEKELSTD